MKTLITWLFGLGFLFGLLITLLLKMWLIIPIYLILTLITIPPLYNLLSKKLNLKLNKIFCMVLVLVLVPLSILIASFYGLIDGKSTLKKTAKFFADDGSALYMYPSLYWPIDKGGHDDVLKNPAITSDKMIFDVFDLRDGSHSGFGGQLAPFAGGYRDKLEKIFSLKQQVSFDYGDLIVFNKELQKNDARVFIQRVIAKGGDKVSLNNGYVFVNDKKIDEPYLAKDQSTYAGIFYNQDKFIKSCEEITVPANHLFVLGDNRMFSDGDSRNFGTIPENGVLGYLPKNYQTTFSKYWLKDNKMSVIKEGEVGELLTFFNQIWQKAGMSKLSTSDNLNTITKNYLKSALENDDLSYTPKNPDVQKAFQEVLNRNPVNLTLIEGIYDLDTYKGYLYLIASDKNVQEVSKDVSKFAFSTFKTEVNGCMKSGTIIASFK